MKNQKGFSLIELLIVVVIIGIIAAIAIPNLLASRRAANESSAVSSTRVVGSSQATYYSTSGNNRNYGNTDDLYANQLIDGVLALSDLAFTGTVTGVTAGPKSGYNMSLTDIDPVPAGEPAHFVSSFVPAVSTGITQTGLRKFCMIDDGVLRSSSDAAGLGTHVNTVAACTATPYVPTN